MTIRKHSFIFFVFAVAAFFYTLRYAYAEPLEKVDSNSIYRAFRQFRVVGEKAVLYDKPSISGKKIGEFKSNAIIDVVARSGEWFEVNYPDHGFLRHGEISLIGALPDNLPKSDYWEKHYKPPVLEDPPALKSTPIQKTKLNTRVAVSNTPNYFLFYIKLPLILLGIWIVYKLIAKQNTAKTADYEQEDSSGNSQQQATQRPQSDEERFANILGLSPSSSLEIVKQRYRELCSKYHPDKVSHLGEEFRVIAEQKLKDINAAYAYFSGK